jgi:hypothetical protein
MRTDRIRCDFPLIEPAHQPLQFHTDDFGKKDRDLTLTRHGRLVWHGYVSEFRPHPPRDHDMDLDCNFLMYAEPEGGGQRIYYRVFLDHGQVTWIRPCNRLGHGGETVPSDIPTTQLSRRLTGGASVLRTLGGARIARRPAIGLGDDSASRNRENQIVVLTARLAPWDGLPSGLTVRDLRTIGAPAKRRGTSETVSHPQERLVMPQRAHAEAARGS